MKYKIGILSLLLCAMVSGQNSSKRVLFLGNSYIYVNNLPQMTADVAASMGDTVVFDSNAPGGHRLLGHSTNATSLSKIAAGNWDYVVLQEQSQFPSFPDQQVEADVFPYAQILDSIINAENPCAETVFYMTWGRKNGDASNCSSWPPLCTYAGMDSLLNLRYRMMADRNNAIVSPVGAVWKYIRQTFPLIELYQADESHPSVAGTYAAACCFYSALFRKDPMLVTFSSTLSTTNAANIRAATKLIVYDSLSNWHIGEYDPSAAFSFADTTGLQVSFSNNSANATTYSWDFGDGTTSTENNPVHTYTAGGTFYVKLSAGKCGSQDSTMKTITLGTVGVQSQKSGEMYLKMYPNPTKNELYLKADAELIGSAYVVYDNTGKTVLSGSINSVNKMIDTGNLSSGLYLLKVSKNMQQTFKVIKE